MKSLAQVLSLGLFLLLIVPLAHGGTSRADLVTDQVLLVDAVGQVDSPAGDILSVVLMRTGDGAPVLRVSFLSLAERTPGLAPAKSRPAEVGLRVWTGAGTVKETSLGTLRLAPTDGRFVPRSLAGEKALGTRRVDDDPDAVYIDLPADFLAGANPVQLRLETFADDTGLLDAVTAAYPPNKAYAANCALVLHGNQGIGYSDVFHGRSDDEAGSGFDEALEVHQATGVPGNFHMSGTLQTSAEWAARNGDPQDFNAWLSSGVTSGWAGMITSAYGQHMMPFVNNAMNDWAVNVQTQMTHTRYGYFPTVAWVPERVWLNTTGYPSSGVNDWIGDNWQGHGVLGVILDDDVHLAGYDNHQIHTLSANGLRLVPRDRNFTGNIIGGNGQASLDILTTLAGSGVGEFRIAVFAEDWEAAAEMGGWAGITPNAVETYEWFINKCATESSWLSTWKLADALNNPNFNGSSISVSPGTYGEIGGADGYGGGDNGWYTHWAGWIPWANGGDGYGNCRNDGIGNCKDYGTLWNDAYGALMAAPDNNLSQAGWYVLMTMLHETAWHDGLGGDISGWQHKYSGHMKNAHIYAEAAHWANGEYVDDVGAYFSDIDNDGYSELIVHNDRLFAVIRGAGGRITNLFVKGPGYDDTAIGNDNAYWSGTDADYNDDNHVGALSDVSPDYKSAQYDLEIVSVTATEAVIRLSHEEVAKEVHVGLGDSHLDITYRVGQVDHWWQSGFSPSLVDLVWNAEMDRVWAADQSFMGQRNPNTGIGTAWVLGTGGAVHQKDFSATLMKGDELTGRGTLQMKLYAGPVDTLHTELAALAALTTDTLGPLPVSARLMAGTGLLRVVYDQTAQQGTFSVGQAAVGTVDLDGAASAVGTAFVQDYTLDPAVVDAILALDPAERLLTIQAGAVLDAGGVAGAFADSLAVDVVTTGLAIDGNVDATEWADAEELADADDSAWTSSNEIDRLLVQWDVDFLYLAIDGQVDGNSWILYLDVDPASGNGETDLTGINAWERGATFTAPGFGADFQYAAYQHQSIYDGDSFWRLDSPTVATDLSGSVETAFDAFHLNGTASGSEIAIPWNVLYGLGDGVVPVGAEISLVASVCWDPEPDGELGGDSAPSNLAAALPILDNAWTVVVDADGNGRPDGTGVSPAPDTPRTGMKLLANVPNPFNPSTTLRFEVPGTGSAQVDVAIFDLRGRRIAGLVEGFLPAGPASVVWTGRTDSGRSVAAGTYFCRFRCNGQVMTRALSLVK